MISFKNIIGQKSEPKKAESEAPTKEKKGNIFGQTLNAGKMVKTKKAEYVEAKNKKKAYIGLGVSFAALMVYSIFFLYENTTAYIKAPSEIADFQAQIEEYKEMILPSLEKTKDLHKAAYDQEFEEVI